jgi:hypothetical protein
MYANVGWMIGVGLGATIGGLAGHVAIGVALGFIFGLLAGTMLDAKERNRPDALKVRVKRRDQPSSA